MPTEITFIETRDGHRYEVTHDETGRELRRAACDHTNLPDGYIVQMSHTPIPLAHAVGKTVAGIVKGDDLDDYLWDRRICIAFTDGSRLLITACNYDGDTEIEYEWEPTE